eukprot:2832174-Ditylum_brightwellii.AAC.3
MTPMPPLDNDKDNKVEPFEQLKKCTNHIYVQIINPDNIGSIGCIFTDQTGKFPWKYSRGNQYILVLYKYDGNIILAKRIKNKRASQITRAFNILHAYLYKFGLKPCFHILDNKVSSVLIQSIKDKSITYQRVPPYCHRHNAAEKAT